MDLFPITFESCRSGIQFHDRVNPLTGQVYRRRSGPSLTAEEKQVVRTAAGLALRAEANEYEEHELAFPDGGLAFLGASVFDDEDIYWFSLRVNSLSRELSAFVFDLLSRAKLVAVADSCDFGRVFVSTEDSRAIVLGRWRDVEVAGSADDLHIRLVAFAESLGEG